MKDFDYYAPVEYHCRFFGTDGIEFTLRTWPQPQTEYDPLIELPASMIYIGEFLIPGQLHIFRGPVIGARQYVGTLVDSVQECCSGDDLGMGHVPGCDRTIKTKAEVHYTELVGP